MNKTPETMQSKFVSAAKQVRETGKSVVVTHEQSGAKFSVDKNADAIVFNVLSSGVLEEINVQLDIWTRSLRQ